MNENIAIIGGDERIIKLADMYDKEGIKTYLYGFESYENINNSDLHEISNKCKIIISSIPFTKDGETIYAPYAKKQILISEVIKNISNKIIFAGSVSDQVIKKANEQNIKIIDLMKQEELTVLNTIATAEGTIGEIIYNTKYNIHGSKILILGFGRVAKVLANKLKVLDANVTCAARKNKDFAWMEALGINNTDINKIEENLKQYDIIINTVPELILSKEKIDKINQETLLIDLASKPGGIDHKYCKDKGLKSIWALAIPGKVAPITSAKYIKNTIDNIIKEGVDN